jgi:hypothetical protein
MKNLDLSYFLTGICKGGTNNPIISCDVNGIYANNETVVERKGNEIYVYGNNTSKANVIEVLSALGVNATIKNNTYSIDGLEWDGSKVNLNLLK